MTGKELLEKFQEDIIIGYMMNALKEAEEVFDFVPAIRATVLLKRGYLILGYFSSPPRKFPLS